MTVWKRFLSVLFALCLIVGILPARARAAEAPGTAIPYIDYNRFMQSRRRTARMARVYLQLGELQLPGCLYGYLPLTILEQNQIIYSQLAEMGLTLEEIQVASTMGENLDGYMNGMGVSKVLVALSNFAPIPGSSALAARVFYGQNATPQTLVTEGGSGSAQYFLKIVDNGIKDTAKQATDTYSVTFKEGVGMVVEKTGTTAGKVVEETAASVLSKLISTAFFTKEIRDNSQYQNLVEWSTDSFDKATEFYIRCARLMNHYTLEKNRDSTGACIAFMPETFVNTDWDSTFLGVGGVPIHYQLTGRLEKHFDLPEDDLLDLDDGSGVYEGELTLTLETKDMTVFDQVFARESTLWQSDKYYSDWAQILWRFPGHPEDREFLRRAEDTANKPTHLKRTLVGKFTVSVDSWHAGEIRPRISGAFNNVSDKVEFTFDHTIVNEWATPEKEPYTMRELGYPEYTYHLTSKEGGGVNVIHAAWKGNEAAMQHKGSVAMVVYSGDGQDIILRPADVGTIWEPLKNAPSIIITVDGP